MCSLSSFQPICCVVSFCVFTCRLSAFLTVWGGQAERKASLLNVKLHAASIGVCIDLTALSWILSRISGKPLLQVGVVGADIDGRVFLVKPKPCSLA